MVGGELCERQVCVSSVCMGGLGPDRGVAVGVDMEVQGASVRCVPSECARGAYQTSVDVSAGVFFTQYLHRLFSG